MSSLEWDAAWSLALKVASAGHGNAAVHNTLESAQRDAGQHTDDLRVWAFDIPAAKLSTASPKHFLVAKVERFARSYSIMAPSERHAYEVLDERLPCWPYFDLEMQPVMSWERANELADAVVVGAISVLTATHPRLKITPIRMSSHRSSRFSMHIILRIESPDDNGHLTPKPLCSLRHASALCGHVAARLPPDTPDNFVDSSVYHDRRAFRLCWSTKLSDKSQTRLLPLPGVLPPEADVAELLATTLIHPETPAGGWPSLTSLDTLSLFQARLPSKPKGDESPSGVRNARVPLQKVCKTSSLANGVADKWELTWSEITATPALDCPRFPHPGICASLSGRGVPPWPFGSIADWADAQLAAVGCEERSDGSRLADWRYLRSERPSEALLHLSGIGGICAHAGRTHTSSRVMVTIDLRSGAAWLRCWSNHCVVWRTTLHGGRRYVKARTPIGIVGSSFSLDELVGFERMYNDRLPSTEPRVDAKPLLCGALRLESDTNASEATFRRFKEPTCAAPTQELVPSLPPTALGRRSGLEVRASQVSGRGLFTTQSIPPGGFIALARGDWEWHGGFGGSRDDPYALELDVHTCIPTRNHTGVVDLEGNMLVAANEPPEGVCANAFFRSWLCEHEVVEGGRRGVKVSALALHAGAEGILACTEVFVHYGTYYDPIRRSNKYIAGTPHPPMKKGDLEIPAVYLGRDTPHNAWCVFWK